MNVKVLIIDDEPDIPRALTDYLEDTTDFTVQTALSGQAGLNLLKTEPIDVCIVDMRLPGMNGNDFILAAHELRPELRFIVHTGSVDYSVPQELRRIGITAKMVIRKPVFTMKEFVIMIEDLMGLESSEQAQETPE